MPQFVGPQTRTTGVESSEEINALADAQSGGTITAGAGVGGGLAEPGLLGLGLGLDMGEAASVARGAGDGDESSFWRTVRRDCRIAGGEE